MTNDQMANDQIRHPPSAIRHPDARPPRVIVVNDDLVQLRLIASVLEQDGLEVMACQSAEESLRLMRERGPADLIVTDLYMPGIDGWRFCWLLRSPEYERFNSVPVLVASATFSGVEAEQMTSDLGANGFLPLPCDPAVLKERVRALLEGRASRPAAGVLVVEDSLPQSRILQRAFELEGYVVNVALTGREARRSFRERAPEILVLDYYLPDTTGEQLLEELKHPGSSTVAIIITGDPNPERAVQLMRKGADGYVHKPFDPQYLIELCEKARRERSLIQIAELLEERTRKLRESEERYRMLIENQGEGLCLVDPDERFVFANPAAESIFGVPPGGLAGRCLQEFTSAEQFGVILEQTETRRAGQKSTYDLDIVRPDGERRQLLVTATPQLDGQGRYIGGFGLLLDITERKRAEQAVRASEERYRGLFENVLEGVYQTTPDGRILSVNPALARMLGYESEQELQASDVAHDLYADPDERKVLTEKLEEQGELRNAELVLKRRDGGEITVLENARAVRDERGQVLYYEGTLTDITERKRAEEALKDLLEHIQQAKEEWESTADSLPELILLCDDQGQIIRANRTVEAWGLGPVVGVKGLGVHDLLHPGCADVVCYFRSFWEQAWKDVSEHRSAYSESFDGVLNRHVQVQVQPSQKPTSRLSTQATVVIVRDVTERKKIEEELLKARKLESIGLLAGGIAHDFNNILMGIIGNLSVAKTLATPGDHLSEMVIAAERAALRARDLTQQLLTFAKGGAPIKKTTSILEIIRESVDFALRGSNVRCQFSIPDTLWPVDVDEAQMSQVISNLIINADQSMPQGGTIRLQAENITVSANDPLSRRPGQYVQITIQDQGTGIPPDHLPKIFDPYFTTKQKGTGLGLATAYSIITKHDGYIAVESELGVGTRFTLCLPAVVGQVRPKKEMPPPAAVQKGRVLVMDDEEIIRDVTGKMLTRLGYEAMFARDGMEAIEAYWKAHTAGVPFDIVIMDLTIPGGMGGKEAIQRLREVDPQVKAIVSSGYSNDPVMANFAHYGFVDVMAKPYKIQDLSQVLHRVLKGPE
jgi:PAS domain S-box-containing protein